MDRTMYLTDVGALLMAEASSGHTVKITHFSVGEGVIDTPTEEVIKARTSLVAPVEGLTHIVFTEGSVESNTVKIKGSFTSQETFRTFNWSEIGIYAIKDDDESTSTLLAYGYDSVPSDVKKLGECSVVQIYDIYQEFTIDSGASVTVLVDSSSSWVSEEDFLAHIDDTSNPHNVVASQIGITGDSGTSTVNNMKPSFSRASALAKLSTNTYENLNKVLGKISRAVYYTINNVVTHIANKNNPHQVTFAQAASEGGVIGVDSGGTGTDGSTTPGGLFEQFWNKLLSNGSSGSQGSRNVLFGVYQGNGANKRKVSIDMPGVGFVLIIPEWGNSALVDQYVASGSPWTTNSIAGAAALSGVSSNSQCTNSSTQTPSVYPRDYNSVNFSTWDSNTSKVLVDYSEGCFYVCGPNNTTATGPRYINLSNTRYYFIAIRTDGTAIL